MMAVGGEQQASACPSLSTAIIPKKQRFLYKIFMIFHNRRGILDGRGVIGLGHTHHLGEVT